MSAIIGEGPFSSAVLDKASYKTSSRPEVFSEDYFMRGEELGISNYTSYKWAPDSSLPMADHLKRFLGIRDGESLLDFGCARGFLCAALRMRGVKAFGYDISEWAIQNCHPSVTEYVSNILYSPILHYDYLSSKDCIEHLNTEEIFTILPILLNATRKAALFIVPLAQSTGGKYIYEKDELDSTHIQRLTLHDWIMLLQGMTSDFVVSGSYRVPLLKKSTEHLLGSTGFLHLTRF